MSSGSEAFVIEGENIKLNLSVAAYRLTAVQAAGYRVAKLCTLVIHEVGAEVTVASLILPSRTSEKVARQVVATFFRELTDQELREKIRADTSAVRALVLAHAFSRTGLISPE